MNACGFKMFINGKTYCCKIKYEPILLTIVRAGRLSFLKMVCDVCKIFERLFFSNFIGRFDLLRRFRFDTTLGSSMTIGSSSTSSSEESSLFTTSSSSSLLFSSSGGGGVGGTIISGSLGLTTTFLAFMGLMTTGRRRCVSNCFFSNIGEAFLFFLGLNSAKGLPKSILRHGCTYFEYIRIYKLHT